LQTLWIAGSLCFWITEYFYNLLLKLKCLVFLLSHIMWFVHNLSKRTAGKSDVFPAIRNEPKPIWTCLLLVFLCLVPIRCFLFGYWLAQCVWPQSNSLNIFQHCWIQVCDRNSSIVVNSLFALNPLRHISKFSMLDGMFNQTLFTDTIHHPSGSDHSIIQRGSKRRKLVEFKDVERCWMEIRFAGIFFLCLFTGYMCLVWIDIYNSCVSYFYMHSEITRIASIQDCVRFLGKSRMLPWLYTDCKICL